MRKALVAFFGGQVISSAGNIVLVPLFLKHWSPALYGEWTTMLSLVGYLSLLDLGMNVAVVNRLTQVFARGDRDEYQRLQGSALSAYVSIATGISVLLAVVVWSGAASGLSFRSTSVRDASWALWLLGLQTIWMLPLGFVLATYRTAGWTAKSQWMTNVLNVATLALVGALLVSGCGVRAVAAWQLLPLVGVALYAYCDIRRALPALRPRLGSIKTAGIRALVVPGLLFALLPMGNAIVQQGSVLVVFKLLGSAAVTVFVISRTLCNLIRQLVTIGLNSMWPDITAMEARGELEALRSIHRLLTLASTALSVGVGAAIWFEGAEIIAVWTNGTVSGDDRLLRALLALIVFGTPWFVAHAFTAATSRHQRLAYSYLVSAVTGVGIAYGLVGQFGLIGAPIGLMIGEGLACYHFVLKDTCRVLGQPYGAFARRVWCGLAGVSISALLAGCAAHHALTSAPMALRWLVVGSATVAGSVGFSWLALFSPDERAKLRSWLVGSRASVHGRLDRELVA